MTTINTFEDIEAWQDARALARMVYQCTRASALARDFGLRDQFQRAAVSVMANIAEGFGRRGDREFIQFLRVARGSCSETLSHAYVALDADLISTQEFEKLRRQTELVGRKISAFTRYLNSNRPND